MASDTPTKSSWGLWSFVETVTSTVKQKSDEIINIYKEDLQEFSRTIVTDTSAVIKDRVDLNNLVGRRSNNPSSSSPSHLQARFLRLQRDEKTYTTEAADQADYTSWAASFNLAAPETTEAITLLLTSSEPVREFHTSLVPAKVAYRDFWCRYYYKLHKIEEEEQRRAVILKNANANDDEDFSWDVEDDNNNSNNNKSTPSPKDSNTTQAPTNIVTNDTTESSTAEVTPTQDTKTASDIAPQPHTTEQAQEPPQEAPPTPEVTQEATQEAPQEQEESSPTPQTHEADDIDEEIARKFESQKLEPQKSEQKSDAEDGWADWE